MDAEINKKKTIQRQRKGAYVDSHWMASQWQLKANVNEKSSLMTVLSQSKQVAK